ncbi:transposase [Streptomyces viridosporus]|uniref:transposase n=1 Tax=Streptomyces viridosporus TaxID=67581 RepID=UPI003F65FF3B
MGRACRPGLRRRRRVPGFRRCWRSRADRKRRAEPDTSTRWGLPCSSEAESLGRGRQATKPLVETVLLGRKPIYQGLHLSVSPTGQSTRRVGKDSLNIVVEIVKRTDDVKGFKVLPRRWVVERSFGWLVRNRRLARDYERLTVTSEAMIKVAMIRLMLVRLAGQPSRWSHESHHKTARTKTVEDQIAA